MKTLPYCGFLLILITAQACGSAPENDYSTASLSSSSETTSLEARASQSIDPDDKTIETSDETIALTPYHLALKAVPIDDTTKSKFPFTKEAGIHIENDTLVSFAGSAGKYVTLTVSDNKWATVQTAADRIDFDLLFRFHDYGSIGVKGNALSLKKGAAAWSRMDGNLVNSVRLGINAGFFATRLGDAITVVEDKAGAYGQNVLTSFPADLKYLEPCSQGCRYWGYTGEKLYLMQADGSWLTQPFTLALPIGQVLSQLAMNLRFEKGEVAVRSAVALTKDGSVFLQDASLSGLSTR